MRRWILCVTILLSSFNIGSVGLEKEVVKIDYSLLMSNAKSITTIDPTNILIIPSGFPLSKRVNLGSKFGMRMHPILKINKFHKGIDIPAKLGTPVIATAHGKIEYSKLSKSYGNTIKIKHSDSYSTKYAHMSKLLVKKGEIVSKGDTIGLVGSTGRSTNSHLHYEVLENNKHKNPIHYLCNE